MTTDVSSASWCGRFGSGSAFGSVAQPRLRRSPIAIGSTRSLGLRKSFVAQPTDSVSHATSAIEILRIRFLLGRESLNGLGVEVRSPEGERQDVNDPLPPSDRHYGVGAGYLPR